MKQGIRFFVRPKEFVNQLQWSTHHWMILFTFLVVTAVEAHVGRQHSLYEIYSRVISQTTGFNYDLILWVVVAAKLLFMLVGSYLVAQLIWTVGSFFGSKNSKRVLFRRLAVVFTMILAGYTANHLQDAFLWMGTASFFLYFWGILLGYFAIREQFSLTHVETAVVGLFAVLLVVSTWHFAHSYMEDFAKQHMTELSQKSRVHSVKKQF